MVRGRSTCTGFGRSTFAGFRTSPASAASACWPSVASQSLPTHCRVRVERTPIARQRERVDAARSLGVADEAEFGKLPQRVVGRGAQYTALFEVSTAEHCHAAAALGRILDQSSTRRPPGDGTV